MIFSSHNDNYNIIMPFCISQYFPGEWDQKTLLQGRLVWGKCLLLKSVKEELYNGEGGLISKKYPL